MSVLVLILRSTDLDIDKIGFSVNASDIDRMCFSINTNHDLNIDRFGFSVNNDLYIDIDRIRFSVNINLDLDIDRWDFLSIIILILMSCSSIVRFLK
jgi:hypothetical protein